MKGVVDCSDLPLNVSREVIQHSPLLEKIQKSLVKNVLGALEDLKTQRLRHLRSGVRGAGRHPQGGPGPGLGPPRARSPTCCCSRASGPRPGKFTTLAQYVEAMPGDQADIYYLAGEQRSVLEHSPSLEVFRHRGWDVLLLTEPIDEFVFPTLGDYRGKALKAADRSAPELSRPRS